MAYRSKVAEPLQALVVAIGLAAIAYGGGNLLAFVFVLLFEFLGIELTTRALFILSVVAIQLITFTGVSLAYLRYRRLSLSDIGVRLPDLEGWIVLGVGFISMLVLLVVGSIGSTLVGEWLDIERESQMIIEIAQQDPFIFILLGVLSLLVVGPAEELLFRGIIQSRVRETFGPVAGVTIPTAIFAMIHLTGYGTLGAGLLGVAVMFLVGFVLALSYEYTDNLVVVALMHGLFNASQAVLGYLSVRFGDPEAMGAIGHVVVVAVPV